MIDFENDLPFQDAQDFGVRGKEYVIKVKNEI